MNLRCDFQQATRMIHHMKSYGSSLTRWIEYLYGKNYLDDEAPVKRINAVFAEIETREQRSHHGEKSK